MSAVTDNRTSNSVPGAHSLDRLVGKQATDKSVRDMPVKAKYKAGQIIVEQGICGVVFSFPAAVWPADDRKQRAWVERLTPWWDLDAPDWTPQAHRLRESCCKAINNLARPVPKTATRWQTGNSLPNDRGQARRENPKA